jgi:ferredoxin-NADP reductase
LDAEQHLEGKPRLVIATATTILIVVASVLCGVLFMRALWAIRISLTQNRTQSIAMRSEQGQLSIELAGKLRRTYFDLSMSRRKVEWREVFVAKVEQESEDVRSFYLIDVDHEPLPGSQPGQHILLERPAMSDVAKAFRCYSLSDDCAEGYWRISVKKNSEYPASVSRWLHDEVKVGDRIRVRGPSGAFYLRTGQSRALVLASAGIGITPMLPMLIEALRRGFKDILVFAQYRDVGHMPFVDSLLDIASKYPQVSMNIWISRFPKGAGKPTDSPFHEGKFQAGNLVENLKSKPETDFYLCGPEEWQTRLTNDLVDQGVPRASVAYELFQQSEKSLEPVPEIKPRNIHFKVTGAVAQFKKSHPSLLGCAETNQVMMESGCRTGACGSCVVRLLDGKVRYTREPQFPTKPNEILPCVCVPESDLVVEA